MAAYVSSSSTQTAVDQSSKHIRRYTDESNRFVVEWLVGGNVRLIAYPHGRGSKGDKSNFYDDDKTVTQRIEEASKAISNGEGCIWMKARKGHLIKPQPSLSCIVPETSNLVTKFSRYPESKEDVSTPFDCLRWKEFLSKFGISHSVFGLKLSSCKIIDTATINFLRENKREKIDQWVRYAHDDIFKKWNSDGEWIPGYHSFSSLAWGITSNFILGVSEEDSKDYAYLWNDMFSPDTSVIFALKLLTLDYKHGMVSYFLKQIKKNIENPSNYPDTFPTYWIKNDLHSSLLSSLTTEEIAQAEESAKALDIDLQTYFLFCTSLTISIAMQENFAFTMTETLKRVCNDVVLLEECKGGIQKCSQAVQETLRIVPPAGHGRQVRWDTTIIYQSGELERVYELDKGDVIETHPLYKGRNPEMYQDPEIFDISRAGKAKVCPFGTGPHRCSGEVIAVDWMAATIHSLITTYRVQVENPKSVEYGVYFTLKSIPEVKIRVSSFEEEEPKMPGADDKNWFQKFVSGLSF